jgi:phosphotransferase system  glucose/maltose/N-acetylglucosamine-specific IIC component
MEQYRKTKIQKTWNKTIFCIVPCLLYYWFSVLFHVYCIIDFLYCSMFIVLLIFCIVPCLLYYWFSVLFHVYCIIDFLYCSLFIVLLIFCIVPCLLYYWFSVLFLVYCIFVFLFLYKYEEKYTQTHGNVQHEDEVILHVQIWRKHMTK